MAVEHKRVTVRTVEPASSAKHSSLRYRVNAEQGSWLTAPGGAVAYGIANSEYRGDVFLVLDGGEIVGASTVDGVHRTGRQR